MKLKGKEKFDVSPTKIWSILMDVERLVNITPGLSRLEEIGEDLYNAFVDIKIGPVKGSFKGEMSLTEKNENESFILNIKQESKIGNVNASVKITMEPDETGASLGFDGEAKLSGLLARTGNRVLSGVSKNMTKQFFENLHNEINK